MKIIQLFLLTVYCFCATAQDAKPTILMMTGKVIDGTVSAEDSAFIYYTFKKKPGKTKDKKLDWERVFSYTDSEGAETIIYVADTAVGNYFTESEMRSYIRGEQDAWDGYKSNWTIWTGIPIAGGLGFVLSSSPLLIAVPFVYMVAASLPKYRMTPGSISDATLLKEPAYVLGYERTARTKRLFKSLASGVIGAGIGMAIGQLTKP